MKGGPKLSLRPFLHRALQLIKFNREDAQKKKGIWRLTCLSIRFDDNTN